MNVNMKTYVILFVFASISYISFRRTFPPLFTVFISAVLATLLFLAFVTLVEDTLPALWLVGLAVSFFLCLLWLAALAVLDRALGNIKARRIRQKQSKGSAP